MKKIWLYLILLVNSASLAQVNLVPNPSFEDTVSCPDDLNQVNRATGWFAAGGTPDYFNSCFVYSGSVFNVGVPLNSWGDQQALTGHGYMAMGTFYEGGGPTIGREAVGTLLISPLQIGTRYYVSFYVSLCDNIKGGANKMGTWFSTGLYQWSSMNPPPRSNQSQIYTDSIITDTVNWVKISGSFISDSNYTYIYIGNFFEDSLVSYIHDPNGTTAYYVENICVSTDSTYCNTLTGIPNESTVETKVEVSPNPFTHYIIIKNLNTKLLKVELFDVLGKPYEILPKLKNNEIEINTDYLPFGLYLLKMTGVSKIFTYKIIHSKN